MLPIQELKNIIITAYDKRSEFSAKTVTPEIKTAVLTAIEYLDQGKIRIAEKEGTQWVVHQWIKQAILLFFQISDNAVIEAGYTNFYDKIPLKHYLSETQIFQHQGTRIVPGACVRKGAYLAPNTIVMPSFVNIGAFVDSGTMIDTWATVGSCAQIGKNVHISGGAGIGGVLEPLQANPTIIEDNCFIGARSEVVEGVIVEENSVLSMGVFIGQSTPIYDRATGEIYYGKVPAGSVVVPGNLPSKDGKYSLYSAIIVKKVDAQTRSKVNLNELLRNLND